MGLLAALGINMDWLFDNNHYEAPNSVTYRHWFWYFQNFKKMINTKTNFIFLNTKFIIYIVFIVSILCFMNFNFRHGAQFGSADHSGVVPERNEDL